MSHKRAKAERQATKSTAKGHGRTSTGTRAAGLPVASKVVQQARDEERQAKGKQGALTMDEKIAILDMYQHENDTHIIAQKFNRSPEAIRKFLWRYRDTTNMAKLRMKAGAEVLADRIIDMANVDQSLEVLDRLDVLAKKRDKGAPATSFTLVMGNFGDKPKRGDPVAPVPSQKQIDDAIDAEAKVVSGKG